MSAQSSIETFVQEELSRRSLNSVTAVDAARWLDHAGLLKDSRTRPGKPLRDLLRRGDILGQRQEVNGRWFIDQTRGVELCVEPAALSTPIIDDLCDKQPTAPAAAPASSGGSRARRSRSASDEAYVIDLCDEVFEETAIRQHAFSWLLGDPGPGGRRSCLPVDGYYPAHSVVVEYRERQHFEVVPFFDRRPTVSGVGRGEQRRIYDARREEQIPKHGLRLVIIAVKHLDVDRRGRLLRNWQSDLAVVKRLLQG
jgi:hypothetical protein